ncbi:MAG: TrkH family potassium uptake protein [Fermentimonas sp.]|jgi:trk system potassium uptake protein TrkH
MKFQLSKHISIQLGPAQIFVLSFLSIIFIGCMLLLLPCSTNRGISFIDALFTATSAVCITGLVVVDTEFTFTLFGSSVILFLIQIGGLGIMTITTYFSYFFQGKTSFRNQLLIRDITHSEMLGNIFSSLKSILLITFVIEGIGMLLIFLSMRNADMYLHEKIYFSIFHSVSSFCNAGFSTLSGNLYDTRVRLNFPLHIIISSLIILGGLGFPVVNSLWKYLTSFAKGAYKRIFKRQKLAYTTMHVSVNTRLVVRTTLLLIIVGTLSFYIFEKDGVLREFDTGVGKWTASFFGSVTTRTAGYNSTDTGLLTLPTTFLFIFLMWIGASPASTGGGIKTTTFAVSIMNFLALIRGKNRVEFHGREISQITISRAFSQMTLSVLFIILMTFFMILIEKDKEPMNLLFETVSAYSTVGLSRNVTPFLSDPGRLLIIFTMFVGRVSLFTMLTCFTKQVTKTSYRYPSEELLIN